MDKLPVIGLTGIKLKQGGHATRDGGVCAMEAVAWLAGEPHSDAPQCACPVLTRYVQRLNDRFNDQERRRLKKYLVRLIGTRDGKSMERVKLLVHRAGTVFAPIALEIRGFKDHADKMRQLKLGDYAEQKKLGYAAAADVAAYAAYAADAAAADVAAAAAVYAADAAAADAAAAPDIRKQVVTEALKALDAALKL